MNLSTITSKIHTINIKNVYVAAVSIVGSLMSTYSSLVPAHYKPYVQFLWDVLLAFQFSPIQLTPLAAVKRALVVAAAAETIIPARDGAKLRAGVAAITAIEPLVQPAVDAGKGLGLIIDQGRADGGAAYAASLASQGIPLTNGKPVV